MQIKSFNNYIEEHKELYQEILELTKSINDTYATYTDWYKNTFIPGLSKGERMYIVAIDEKNKLAGCVLLKNTEEEKKICTIFVAPSFRRRGLGTKLIEQALIELGSHPLITVSSRKISQLEPLLNKMGFHLSAKIKGVYKDDDTEFYFNDKKSDLIKDRLLPTLMQLRDKRLK